MLRSIRILTTATAFAALAGVAGAQDKPLTVKQVAKNVQSEAHRAGARTRDAAHKAGTQTNKQAQRTGKSAARVVSRDARNGDYDKFKGEAPLTSGAQPLPFPEDVMMAAFDASRQVYDELSNENAEFKRMWEAQKSFLNDWYLYGQTTDYTFDTMMMIQQRNGKL